MSSIFTQIINKNIHAYEVAEDKNHLAFLDIYPIKIGHTLVIPKKEINNFFKIEDKEFSQLMIFVKKVALSIEKAISCKRIGLVVMGFKIPHAHVHLIPMDKESDLDFSLRKSLSKDKLLIISNKIKNAFLAIHRI
ncbi:MAG: HIT family protein [Candidatus Bostrichicola ureolyticus]|nr:MAG: HIT family protein [Candidatus Bostrichicola ureolyticus]